MPQPQVRRWAWNGQLRGWQQGQQPTGGACPDAAFPPDSAAADFWNKRWNQVVSNLLRQVTYDPIMEGEQAGGARIELVEGRGRVGWPGGAARGAP